MSPSEKISQLPTYSTPLDADTIIVNDVANGITKLATRNNFLTASTISRPTISGMKAIGGITDTTGNEILRLLGSPSAVNEVSLFSNITNQPPIVRATGDDSNIDLRLESKGTGVLNFNGNQLKIVTGSNGGSAGGSANYIKIGPLAIAYGITNSISITAAAQATAQVNFPITFSSAPAVTMGATPSATVAIQPAVNTTPTTTTLTVAVDATTGTQTGSMVIHWFAIGPA